MTSRLPFMPFYGADFYESQKVGLMDHAERGIYLELLWKQWREGSLPFGDLELARLVGVPSISKRVLHCFPYDADNRRRTPRLEEIRAQHLAIQEKLSEAGKRGRAKQLGVAQARPGGGPGVARAELGESESASEPEEATTTTTARAR